MASATIAEVEANRATPSSANASRYLETRLDQKNFFFFFLVCVFLWLDGIQRSCSPRLFVYYLLVRERTGRAEVSVDRVGYSQTSSPEVVGEKFAKGEREGKKDFFLRKQ